MKKLPLEILENIYIYLSFDKIVYLSKRIADKIFNKSNVKILILQYSHCNKTLDYLFEKNPDFLESLHLSIKTRNLNLLKYLLKIYKTNLNKKEYYIFINNLINKSLKDCNYDINNNAIHWLISDNIHKIDYRNIHLIFKWSDLELIKFIDKNINNIDYIELLEKNDTIYNYRQKILWLFNKVIFTKDIILKFCCDKQDFLYILYEHDLIDNQILDILNYKCKLLHNKKLINFFREKEFIKKQLKK